MERAIDKFIVKERQIIKYEQIDRQKYAYNVFNKVSLKGRIAKLADLYLKVGLMVDG